MKKTFNLSISATIVMVIVSVCSLSAVAQQYNSKRKFYVGLDVGAGTRSFKMKTDIEALKGLAVEQEGYNLGLLIGGDVLRLNFRKGFYRAAQSVGHRIDIKESELGVNFFPVQLKPKKRYFRPYMTAGFMLTNMTFFGSYELPDRSGMLRGQPEGEGEGAAETCCCASHGSGMPAEPSDVMGSPSMGDPDAISPLADETGSNDDSQEAGRISDVRLNVGGGMMLMAPLRSTFIKLFFEVKYGLPLAAIPVSPGFENTKISNPVSVNFGIGFGLKNR
ncbi:MAG TPA: hypothetical protein VGK59_20270 [Ohtaekwangia sp.]